jgi:cytoskeletal protein CcmA (bactofilin family)
MSATVIGASARVHGSISVDGTASTGPAGDLIVEGRVDGGVRAAGRLTLGPKAVITGEIVARDVRIAGRLDRGVQASGVIHLLATAEVHGDLEAARVIIDDGAIFEGQVRLRRSDASRPAPAPIPSAIAAPIAAPPAISEREIPSLSSPGRRRIQRRQP